MACVEAMIDFGEDEIDVIDSLSQPIRDTEILIDQMKLHLSDDRKGERLR